MRFCSLLAGLLSGALLACAVVLPSFAKEAPLELVESVNLTRYEGSWYEQAKIPNWAQRSCLADVTDNYVVYPSGFIRVTNRCTTKQAEHEVLFRAVAKPTAVTENAAWRITFFEWFGKPQWWLANDNLIVGLDEEDYAWTIISGDRDKRSRYAWVMSRQTELSAQQWAAVLVRLQALGYTLDNFESSPQEGGFATKRPLREALAERYPALGL